MGKAVPILGSLSVLLALLLSCMNLQHGNLNQDEGWYLYAAKMVSEGHKPYADFAFTQGPVLPQVYAALFPIVGKFGVAGGRAITTVFGLLAAGFAGLLAFRTSEKRWVALIAVVLLIAGNVYQSYFTTVVKTYGLTAFFLMAGFYLLTLRNKAALVVGGALLALAAGTRLSAGIVLPITGVWLIFQTERKLDWLWFGIGGGVMLLAVYAPPFFQSSEQAHFGLLGYHAGRDPGGLGALLTLKVGFISRFVQAYFIFTLLTLAALIFRPLEKQRNPTAALLWCCGIGISLVHGIAAFPYDDYQAIAYPVLATAVMLTILPRIGNPWVVPSLSFLLLASIAAAFSSPINQDWFVRGRDRIWWQFKEQSDLALLRDAAEIVKQHSPEGSELLTQDTYLAIEANRSVPRGMEMGPFSYYPDMPTEQAEKMHLLNRDLLFQTLETSTAPVAAFSGYGLAIESPAITEISPAERASFSSVLESRFDLLQKIPYFGQAHTELIMLKRREAE
ncbi:hypothetical protein [Pontiella agarivorans]|uniref:Glycosyltransferase RgtA/B/C/D-like domain-containing protein n=1 Tax=Pontiella agarivorans TaxID=3038953 RepID=A0ABU5N038_9BACT|nr:hypothetical protein [Pontiella agarivorans]MDZ8119817.1 hypothetical protein [Pontiella agarivorans]